MADYYQQFSEVFEFKTKEQSDLFCKLAAMVSELHMVGDFREMDEEHEDEALLASLDEDVQDELCRLAEEQGEIEYEDHGDNEVWVYGEEYGNLDALAIILQETLKKTGDTDSLFQVTWSETCNKPRAGAFGGGFMVVGANGAEWGGVHSMARKVAEEWKK